ncbi:MAG: glycosyltransferase family 4 protein [Chlamydiota bacterium]
MKALKRFLKRLVPPVFGLGLCGAASCLILPVALLLHRRYVPFTRRRGGRLAIVVTRIPDQTLHFIYREVARLREIFDCALVALERGDDAYETPLTRRLAGGIAFMPSLDGGAGFAACYLAYLKYLILHPLRVANLIRLYRREGGGGWWMFCSPRSAPDRIHPVHGFLLAHLLEGQGISHIHAYCSNITTNFAIVAAHMLGASFSFNAYVDFDFQYGFKMLDEKLDLCDFAVVHTAFCRERLLEYTSERHREKIHLVRFGLDLERVKPCPASGSKRPRLLIVGGLVPKKGHRHLLRACGMLKERGVDFELFVIGDGPLRARLRDLSSALKLDDRVVFTGGLPNDEAMAYFTPDAVLVHPSVYAPDGERDGFPTVISEAMAMGVPVVSTYVSGIPEVIRDRKNGLLVTPEDPGALAEAIRTLLSDRGLRAHIAAAGIATAGELFDSSRWIPEIRRLLEVSLGGGGA